MINWGMRMTEAFPIGSMCRMWNQLAVDSKVNSWFSQLHVRHHTDFVLGIGSSPQEHHERSSRFALRLGEKNFLKYIKKYKSSEKTIQGLFSHGHTGPGSARQRHPWGPQEEWETFQLWMSRIKWIEWIFIQCLTQTWLGYFFTCLLSIM